jgi:hypothetical protein
MIRVTLAVWDDLSAAAGSPASGTCTCLHRISLTEVVVATIRATNQQAVRGKVMA